MVTKTENVTGERQVPIRLSPCVDYPIFVTEQAILFFLIRLFFFLKKEWQITLFCNIQLFLIIIQKQPKSSAGNTLYK